VRIEARLTGLGSMCEFCIGDRGDFGCDHPTCREAGCACSLSGPARCPTCGHGCLVWYDGLGVDGAPYSITDFLGGSGTESPGYGDYPSTKSALVAAARTQIAESEEPNFSDLDWLTQRLPEGNYRDAGEVFSALQPPIVMPRLEGATWFSRVECSAIPLGTPLQVGADGVALLVDREGAPLDVFAPGEYRLSREAAPLAAARSRPPAPGFAHGTLRSSVIFYSTRDQQGTLSVSGPSGDGGRMFVTATVRFSLSDPQKFARSSVGRRFSDPLPPDRLLQELVGPELARVIPARLPSGAGADSKPIEEAIHRALESAGLRARDIRVDYAGTSPFGNLAAQPGRDPFAHLPPDMRAKIQDRVEEAMHRRMVPAGGATSATIPSGAGATTQPTAGRVCSKCHTTNPGTGKFCHQCGAPLVAKRSCPSCGQEAAAAVKFCGSCGTRLG
jgi:hypothetical protein